ncbi:MAG: hypothetical protein KY451_14170 [Actinobacteria bacterium]|nr:hypothetical protein [Actinomycetota bacterium]MBW3648321.1 hypothetical protein [Actinomycetota bacterium]
MTSGAGSRHRQATARLAALSLVALLLASCTSGDPTSTATGTASQAATGAAASSSRTAELAAGLTQVLVERVYVTQAARNAVASSAARADPPSAEASRVALDASSQAVASVLGAVYDDAQPPLLLALRGVDRLQLEHALTLSQGDVAVAAVARAALEQAQLELSAVLRRIVPALGAEQIRDRLMPDLEAQLAAGGADPYTALRTAAARARDTARVLTDAIAEDRQLGVSGTRASRLRADLTALLTEHVLLAGGLAGELAKADGGAVASARSALDANALEFAAVLGRSYPAMNEPFLQAWAAHVVRVEDYTRAAATGGAPQGEALRGFADALADLLAQNVVGLPAGRISAELAPALEAMLRAIDAAANGSPDVPAELRRAAATTPAPAALLAAAIAEDLRLR